jgi:hypothetical protein
MSTDIIVTAESREFTPVKYNAMRRAIAECVSIDDCNEAQSKAAAMATYYKQIQDEVSVRQLKEIRLRAWRRMSEIVATVDVSRCATQKAMSTLVRETLGHDATHMISDSRIIQLIKLAGVPDRSFEAEVVKGSNLEMLIYSAHPEQIEKRKLQNDQEKANRERIEKERAALEQAGKDSAAKEAQQREARADAVIEMVKEKAIMESPEVGLTLTPKMKANLVSFSVMMDRQMHDQLRDAAHERRCTMWEILREASNYWFVVNGYDKV